DGKPVFKAAKPKAIQAVSPQAAFLITNVIAGNTDPKQNPIWAGVLAIRNGPHGARRPAAAKTGTTNETRDFTTFGFLAPPKSPDKPALVVGVWMGNSDHSEPKGREVTSLDGPSRVWQAFMRDASRKTPIATFRKPSGVVRAKIDAFTLAPAETDGPGGWYRRLSRTRPPLRSGPVAGAESDAGPQPDPDPEPGGPAPTTGRARPAPLVGADRVAGSPSRVAPRA